MLDLNALYRTVEVDAVEPFPDARIQDDLPAAVHQHLARQANPLALALLDHGVQIRQHAVHLGAVSEFIRLFPEGIRLHIQARNKAVVLHILGAEGFIEVIHDGDDRSFHSQLLVVW